VRHRSEGALLSRILGCRKSEAEIAWVLARSVAWLWVPGHEVAAWLSDRYAGRAKQRAFVGVRARVEIRQVWYPDLLAAPFPVAWEARGVCCMALGPRWDLRDIVPATIRTWRVAVESCGESASSPDARVFRKGLRESLALAKLLGIRVCSDTTETKEPSA
jgi:hypothetical protein